METEDAQIEFLVRNRLTKSRDDARKMMHALASAKDDGLEGFAVSFSRPSASKEELGQASLKTISEEAGIGNAPAQALPAASRGGSGVAIPEAASRGDVDLFESALNLEEQHIAEGRDAGRRDGRQQGFEEGAPLGMKKAFEIAQQIGYFWGCVQVWRQLADSNPALFSGRAQRAIDSFQAGVTSFPLDNPEDERMQDMLDDLDGKFKAIIAMLGATDKYFPKSSTASTSLEF